MSKDNNHNNITRKEALKQMGALALGSTLFPSLAAGTASGKGLSGKPNILFIITEDCSPSYFRCYGNEQSTQPNVSRLADAGILFQNACTASPVCAPSRFSFMTGVHCNSAGTQDMRSYNSVPDFMHFYPHYLEKAGYFCVNRDKVDYNTLPPGVKSESRTKYWDNIWDEANGLSQNPFGPGNGHRATYRDRAPGQPFHETVTFMTTHEHVIFPSFSGWRPKDKLIHNPEDLRVPAYLPDIPEVRHGLAQYYDQVQKEDALIGKLLDQLEKDGVADDTFVFLFSDHAGVLPRSKRFMFDSGTRVPLIVRVPPKYQHLVPYSPGTIIDRPVNLVDLPPTVMKLAGIEIPSYYQGQALFDKSKKETRHYSYSARNRMDETYDTVRTVRDKRYRYIRNYMPNRIYGQHIKYMFKDPAYPAWENAYKRGILNETQSKFWKTKPPEELYDCIEDPDNVRNLADNPDYASVLMRMRKANKSWIRQMHDAGFMPEAMMLMRAKKANTTIYEYVRSKQYPQEKIISMAEVASMGNPKNLGKLMDGFTDADGAVRYWAAYGCAILKKKAMTAKQGLIKLLDDPYPDVAIAAAEALYYLGEQSQSLDRLKKALYNSHENGEVQLHALNVLRTFGTGAMPLLPELEALEQKSPPSKADCYGLGVFIARYMIEQLLEAKKGSW